MRLRRLLLLQAAAWGVLLAGASTWPASIRVTGATGSSAASINGYYAIENASQLNGKPVWVKQDARSWSLWFLAGRPSYWLINNAACRDSCRETNLTYKVAQLDDPTQEVGVWVVPTGPSLWEQDILLEEGSWPQLVGIGGAVGANAGSINGNFSRSPTEVRNGKPVWISSEANASGWGLWYNANAGLWLLSSAAERASGGTGGCLYKPASEADPVRELGQWTVNNGTAWVAQTLVVRDLASPAIAWPTSIRVTGASGPNAFRINGYYIMQGALQLGGRPVWVKADNVTAAPGWGLWYFPRWRSWVITNSSSRRAGNGGNDTNIIYKSARYDAPTQENSSWMVRMLPGVVEPQSVKFEDATWPERFRMENATGKSGGYVNGEFWRSPTEEANGRPVWILQDPTNAFNTTLGIWYCMSPAAQWILSAPYAWKTARNEGTMFRTAFEADPVREKPPWFVWTANGWQEQMVVAWDPALPAQAWKAPTWPVSIRVTGATGKNAANVNGYYALDNTTQLHGRPLWLKADAGSAPGWGLWWYRRTDAWLITNRSMRLVNSDSNILFKEANALMPTEQVSTWTVATASGPQEQAVRLEAASWPDRLRITGATGSYAQSINGNYSRSPVEVRNGRPVWLLETDLAGLSNLGIWFSAVSNQWLLSSGGARDGTDLFSIMYKEVTEADPTRELGPWWVKCDSQWCALPLAVRDPDLPDMPSQPSGQAAATAGRAQGGPVLGVTATVLICVGSILAGCLALICLPAWIVYRRKWAAQKAVVSVGAMVVPEEAQLIPEYWTNRDPGRRFEEWVEIDKHTMLAIAALADATWIAQWTEATWAIGETHDPCGGMPTGMQVVKAFRVENLTLWQRYTSAREHILEQRKGNCIGVEEIAGAAVRKEARWDSRTLRGVNEVYLWVGATPSAATGICQGGFRPDLASNFPGATYGTGVYLAECSSRSDQRAGDDHTGPYKGVFCMMLCRVVLGNAFQITGGAEDSHAQMDLESTMASKKFDSVVANRQLSGSTASCRDFVVYDPAQVYPEYVILYLRKGIEAATSEDGH